MNEILSKEEREKIAYEALSGAIAKSEAYDKLLAHADAMDAGVEPLKKALGEVIWAIEAGEHVNSNNETDTKVYRQWFGVAFVEHLRRVVSSLPKQKGEADHADRP